MEQHPIPQQISSYQFRLVGDMTLKQFFQLAGGALVSLILYASALPAIIKWPLMIFFALFGAALAFLPLEERPLSRWIIAFFTSIYSPTLFFWKKTIKNPSFFQEETALAQPQGSTTSKPPRSVGGYILSATQRLPFFSKLEDAELAFLNRMTQLFGPGSPTSGELKISPPTPTTPTPTTSPSSTSQFQPLPIVEPISRPRIVVEETSASFATPQVKYSSVAPVVQTQNITSSMAAQFSTQASPPTPPTIPNTISGQIIDTQGKIVEGAILEIRDAAGRPVRALKTNMLGHFMIATPLLDGNYEIIIEKDGLTFDTVTFETRGEIIPPIAIRAKSAASEQPTAISQQTQS